MIINIDFAYYAKNGSFLSRCRVALIAVVEILRVYGLNAERVFVSNSKFIALIILAFLGVTLFFMWTGQNPDPIIANRPMSKKVCAKKNDNFVDMAWCVLGF